jgi:hypothetical protein
MELPTNPFAVLTFISAPAVLTNASCVLLFGTGNRYGRAVDRVHALAGAIETGTGLDATEVAVKMRELQAGEKRASLIVRALTCFYTAVAGFVLSTLMSLLGALLVGWGGVLAWSSIGVALVAGTTGVAAMIAGALMLARETRYSFTVLQEERVFLARRLEHRVNR